MFPLLCVCLYTIMHNCVQLCTQLFYRICQPKGTGRNQEKFNFSEEAELLLFLGADAPSDADEGGDADQNYEESGAD